MYNVTSFLHCINFFCSQQRSVLQEWICGVGGGWDDSRDVGAKRRRTVGEISRREMIGKT